MAFKLPKEDVEFKKYRLLLYITVVTLLATGIVYTDKFFLIPFLLAFCIITQEVFFSVFFDTNNFINKLAFYNYIKKENLPAPTLKFGENFTFLLGDYSVHVDFNSDRLFVIHNDMLILHSGYPAYLDKILNNKIINQIKQQIL